MRRSFPTIKPHGARRTFPVLATLIGVAAAGAQSVSVSPSSLSLAGSVDTFTSPEGSPARLSLSTNNASNTTYVLRCYVESLNYPASTLPGRKVTPYVLTLVPKSTGTAGTFPASATPLPAAAPGATISTGGRTQSPTLVGTFVLSLATDPFVQPGTLNGVLRFDLATTTGNNTTVTSTTLPFSVVVPAYSGITVDSAPFAFDCVPTGDYTATTLVTVVSNKASMPIDLSLGLLASTLNPTLVLPTAQTAIASGTTAAAATAAALAKLYGTNAASDMTDYGTKTMYIGVKAKATYLNKKSPYSGTVTVKVTNG